MNKLILLLAFSVLLIIPLANQESFAQLCPLIPNCVTGNMYVADSGFSRISEIDPSGNLIDANFITGLTDPTSIAIDSIGNLYVANTGLDTVRQYDSSGNLIDANFITGLNNPLSIAFDLSGNLHVLHFNTISKYDSTGNLITANLVLISNAKSIAFDSLGRLYLVQEFAQIRQYDSDGNLIDLTFNTPGFSHSQPSLTFDPSGNLYVSVLNIPAAVRQYDSSGNLLNNDFAPNVIVPRSIAFDSAGNLFVGNQAGFDIQKYDINGNFLGNVGGPSYSFPKSIAFAYAIESQDVVGGEIIPIETTSLLLTSTQSFSWMIPVILSGIGIGLFVFRKSENA